MIRTVSTLDVSAEIAALRRHRACSVTITEDGTCIIVDPDIGAVSGRNREAAEAEIRRLKEIRNDRRAA